ncbi:MAG: hypothetical protein HC867_01450 [Bacteroidia bacterium]|nr:hypothetical protein [Bacteroidia bacterium]
MNEWKDITFGELVTFQRGHDLTQTNFNEGNYIVAGSNGPIGYHNDFTTNGPGLTIGRSGNSIGVAHYYENDFGLTIQLYTQKNFITQIQSLFTTY